MDRVSLDHAQYSTECFILLYLYVSDYVLCKPTSLVMEVTQKVARTVTSVHACQTERRFQEDAYSQTQT